MTAKQYLSGLQLREIRMEQLREEWQDYLDMGMSITARTGPVKVQTSSPADMVGDAAAKAADIGRRIDGEIADFYEYRHRVTKEIQSLNNSDYIRILFKIYVQYKSLKVTAGEMKRSYSYVRETHLKALAGFEDRYHELLEQSEEERK